MLIFAYSACPVPGHPHPISRPRFHIDEYTGQI